MNIYYQLYIHMYILPILFLPKAKPFGTTFCIQKKGTTQAATYYKLYKVRNESQVFFFRDVHNGILTYLCNKSINTHNTVLKK